jgi:SAM-dependent methyltransferase
MTAIHNEFGGFSANDGTINFYLRVRSILNEKSVVLDLGAGRAAWYVDDMVATRKNIRFIKPIVEKVIAVDVDDAVMNNQSSSENYVYDGKTIPVQSQSIDVVIADYVLEHILDPIAFKEEVDRVLKPGGYFCARTPHKYNYIAVGARLIKNDFHTTILSKLQSDRKEEDVFPIAYKLNRLIDVDKYFFGWKNTSFIFRADPAYYFNSSFIYRVQDFFHRILPRFFVGNLFIFISKPIR